MNTKLVLFVLSLLPFASVAQSSTVEIKGTITNTTDIEGTHILNTTSRYNTVSNATGHFTINARLSDTLVVSSIRYMPQQVVVTSEVIESATIIITLEELVNELDEVVLAPRLSGDLERDLKNIQVKKQLNFYDVGLPGFKGKPEEKIVPAYTLRAPMAVNIEAVYNHLSGYYKKLRKKRKWEAQNNTVAFMLNTYSREFFDTAYGVPENRVYDFLLFCIETTSVQQRYKEEDYAGVLAIFELKASEYVDRLSTETKEVKKEE